MNIGDELGNYVIDAEIGSGTFGVVYRAHNKTYVEMQRAIKVLRSGAQHDPELAKLFEREAAILQTVDSPHVCRIFDVGHTPDKRPYITMELLEGETLAQALTRGPLAIEVALDYVRQICEGLAEVHRQNIIHRDVKPANIFVTTRAGRPVLKLLDFNISKRVRPVVGTTLSNSEAGPGTDHYMSPEQITEPDTVDATTDVWALGAVLFEMVAGFPPFRGTNPGAIKVSIVTGNRHALPPAASSVRAIIDGCLAERGRRFTLADLAAEVTKALGSRTAPSPPERPVSTRKPATETDRSFSVRVLDAFARQWLVISLGLLSIGGLLLLGSFAVHPALNEFTVGSKRVGYISSINWVLVHSFLCPISFAILGRFLGAANTMMAAIGGGAVDEWRRRSKRILVMWLVLSTFFAVGYTIIEWRPITTGSCNSGAFIGWPNMLCAEGRDPASLTFMYIAATAQAAVLCVAWLWFSVLIWMCELLFGKTAIPQLESRHVKSIGELFGMAMWGWLTLFVGLFLARLWSFHLHTPNTNGLLETIGAGLPGTLLEINAHTQSDIGSMLAGTVIFASALAPFAMLRMRVGDAATLPAGYKWVVVFGAVGLIALVFPRLGVFCLTALAVLVISVSRVRRSLPSAWRKTA